MSVYYQLFCRACNEATDFLSRGDTFTWMGGSEDNVPPFVMRHADHLAAICILDEDTVSCMQQEAEEDEINERRFS